MSNFIPQDPLILLLVIVEPFGGAPADLVEGGKTCRGAERMSAGKLLAGHELIKLVVE